MTPIGFRPLTRDWEGPVCLEFTFHSRHTRTARYQTVIGERQFDLYAPLFMLKGLDQDEVPPRLLSLIGRAPETLRVIGFRNTGFVPRIDSDVCEYTIADAKVNSLRYDFVNEGQTYALYIPYAVFGGEAPPRAVYLRLGVPSAQ